MKLIIFLLAFSFLLVADSVKVDIQVTFHDLTLEQATELEKIINKEFKGYSFTIDIPEGKKMNLFRNNTYEPINDFTLPYLKWGDTLNGDWLR